MRIILRRLSLYTLLTLMAVVMLFPLLFTLTNSFMSGLEITTRYSRNVTPESYCDIVAYGVHFVEFSLVPYYLTLGQYLQLLTYSPIYLGMFWNSVLITLPVVLGQCLVSAPAAYAFEYASWRHKEKQIGRASCRERV